MRLESYSAPYEQSTEHLIHTLDIGYGLFMQVLSEAAHSRILTLPFTSPVTWAQVRNLVEPSVSRL